MRRIFQVDAPDKSVITLGETSQPHLIRMTVEKPNTDPIDVLLDEAALSELSYLRFSFSFKNPEEGQDVTHQVLSLAAA